MRKSALFLRGAAFVVALLSTFGSFATTVAASWAAVVAAEPEFAAADRRWWSLLGVSVLALVVTVWTAHRLRAALIVPAEDEPILWI
ncbi:MAG: hypothetical protein OEL76_01050 [Siculibacillus sp.]|nr:hypothetical protein [Siculibacillus sp.]